MRRPVLTVDSLGRFDAQMGQENEAGEAVRRMHVCYSAHAPEPQAFGAAIRTFRSPAAAEEQTNRD